jgi:hypothetical protein
LDYDRKNNNWFFSGGVEAKLMQVMRNYFNFTYKIINCYNDWGIELPNKTWTGIIVKIASKVL